MQLPILTDLLAWKEFEDKVLRPRRPPAQLGRAVPRGVIAEEPKRLRLVRGPARRSRSALAVLR